MEPRPPAHATAPPAPRASQRRRLARRLARLRRRARLVLAGAADGATSTQGQTEPASARQKVALQLVLVAACALGLALAREWMIARHLGASDEADRLFRGLVAIGLARSTSLALHRARWVGAARDPSVWQAARRQLGAALGIGAAAAALALALELGVAPHARGPVGWTGLACVLAAVVAHLRALHEHGGRAWLGVFAEAGVAGGVVVGIAAAVRSADGALAAAALAGITIGLALAGITLGVTLASRGPAHAVPQRGVARGRARPQPAAATAEPPRSQRARALAVLTADAVAYGNLGVVDAAFAPLLGAGGLARLTYAGLVTNTALSLVAGAATVLGLRAAAGEDGAHAARSLARHAARLGLAVAAAVTGGAALLASGSVQQVLARALGWDVGPAIAPIVLAAAPWAGLRAMNMMGRARALLDPRPRRAAALLLADVAGLLVRVALLWAWIASAGAIVVPLAAAAAELLQLPLWLGRAAARREPREPGATP